MTILRSSFSDEFLNQNKLLYNLYVLFVKIISISSFLFQINFIKIWIEIFLYKKINRFLTFLTQNLFINRTIPRNIVDKLSFSKWLKKKSNLFNPKRVKIIDSSAVDFWINTICVIRNGVRRTSSPSILGWQRYMVIYKTFDFMLFLN